MSAGRHAVVLTIAALVAGGCSDGADAPDGSSEVAGETVQLARTVAIKAGGYRPARVEVLVGGTVTWVNEDPASPHTAETEPGRYSDLPGGEDAGWDTHTLTWHEPYTVTFHKPGTFEYQCSLHDMRGKVDVVTRESPGS